MDVINNTSCYNFLLPSVIPVFGFVNPNVTVSEGIGIYIQNVTVYVPKPEKRLSGQFVFLLSSVDISASLSKNFCLQKKIDFTILIQIQVLVTTMLQLLLEEYSVPLMTTLGTRVLEFLLLIIPSKNKVCS